jgi:hypothetical protein
MASGDPNPAGSVIYSLLCPDPDTSLGFTDPRSRHFARRLGVKKFYFFACLLVPTVKSGNVVTVGQCRHLHSNFLLQHSLLVCEDMKFLQKDVMLALILCIQFCDVRIGFIFKYFVIRDTPVLGDDFILGNSEKANRNLQEGPNLLSPITLDIVIIIQN